MTLTVTCPVCRDNEFPVNQNKQIDRTIKSPRLHIYCTKKKEGCMWQGEINDIVGHLNCCQYEDIKCENKGCGNIMQRQHLNSHMELHCQYRNVNCQHCHLLGKHLFIESKHKDECPKFPLPCPNGCKVGTITREDVDKHREICPLEMIKCEYYDMGCKCKIARQDIKDHNRENVDKHLNVLKSELVNTKKKLIQTQKDAVTAAKIMQKKIDDVEAKGKENIKILEMQLYNSICQIHKNFNPWTLKLDTLAVTSTSGEQVTPVVLKMTDFTKWKMEKEWWHSNPFYTHNKESKIRLLVYAAGDTDGEATFLSVCLSLMENSHSNSDERGLPFNGKIEVLNQMADQDHHCVMVDCMVTKRNWLIYREPFFITHGKLNTVSDTCCLLKNDCLFFQVHMEMQAVEQLEELEERGADYMKPPMQQKKPHPQEEHVCVTNDVQSSLHRQVH